MFLLTNTFLVNHTHEQIMILYKTPLFSKSISNLHEMLRVDKRNKSMYRNSESVKLADICQKWETLHFTDTQHVWVFYTFFDGSYFYMRQNKMHHTVGVFSYLHSIKWTQIQIGSSCNRPCIWIYRKKSPKQLFLACENENHSNVRVYSSDMESF